MELSPESKIKLDDAVSGNMESSSSISSPPLSPRQNYSNSDTIQVARPQGANLAGGVVNGPSATPAQAANASAHALNGNISTQANTVPQKPKRQRKKKETAPDGKPVATTTDKPKEKKPRKPREPKPAGEKSTLNSPFFMNLFNSPATLRELLGHT